MKRIFAVAVFCFAALTLRAQVSQQVEVTKAYVPHVGRADKLAIVPNMTDTVALRPAIEYSITPKTWGTVFETRKISPISVSANPYYVSRPCYIKAAVGYPLQSLLDAYLSRSNDAGDTFGVFLKHYGSYSRLGNDYDSRRNNALLMDNAAGLFGVKNWGRYSLGGSLSYDNRLAHRYGVFALDSVDVLDGQALIPGRTEDRRVDIGNLRGDVRFGNAFADMSHFNFALGLGAGFVHDAAKDRQVDLDAFVRIGKMYGRSGFDFTVDYDGWIGAVAISDASFSAVGVRPKYVLRSRKVTLSAGVDYVYTYDRLYGSRHNILPAVDLRLDVVKGYFIPYITASGRIVDAGFGALSSLNPYVAPGSVAPSGRTIDLRVGIEGSVKGNFFYRIFAGYSSLSRMPFFVSLYMPAGADDTGQFGVISDDADLFTAGGELQLMFSDSFKAEYSVGYYGYDADNLPYGGGMPKYDMNLSLRYAYRDKFSISASARLIGARYFPEIDARHTHATVWRDYDGTVYTTRTAAAVDLGVDVDFRLSKTLWGFVSGKNLANSRLYPYNHYRALGVGALLGVKLLF